MGDLKQNQTKPPHFNWEKTYNKPVVNITYVLCLKKEVRSSEKLFHTHWPKS